MKTILVDASHCFIQKQNEGYGVYQDMVNLLETYPNKKIVLTNANEEGVKKYGLDKIPYEFFSLNNNPGKIDSVYYKTMLKKLNLGKDDVVCFEHDKNVVKSAQSVGINTYFYDEDIKDLVSLRKFLDNNLK